jgi:hypothetical protein
MAAPSVLKAIHLPSGENTGEKAFAGAPGRSQVLERQRSPRDALREVLPLDQLHHQPKAPAGGSRKIDEPVDGGDVRMIERGECRSLRA